MQLNKISKVANKNANLMADKDSCIINSKQIRKLPELHGYSKHLLSTDAHPRCLAVEEVMITNKTFHIFEVDTSDVGKLLSTQLLKMKSLNGLRTWKGSWLGYRSDRQLSY